MDRNGACSGRPPLHGAARCAVLLGVLFLLLLACTAGPAGGDRSADTPTAPAELPGHATTGGLPSPLPVPTDDAASEQAAIAQATAVVTAFARPGLDPDTWWAQLVSMLSPAAVEAYAGTDPAEVPAGAVTGAAWVGESASSYLATVFVPTDAGDYAVLLVRDGGGAPWLVERISQVQPGSADSERVSS